MLVSCKSNPDIVKPDREGKSKHSDFKPLGKPKLKASKEANNAEKSGSSGNHNSRRSPLVELQLDSNNRIVKKKEVKDKNKHQYSCVQSKVHKIKRESLVVLDKPNDIPI